MRSFNRRVFMSSSLGAMTALSIGDGVFGQESATRRLTANEAGDKPHDAIFLTWQRDPTSTITIQWIGRELADDTTVRYSPRSNLQEWAKSKLQNDAKESVATTVAEQSAKVRTKPFPGTELKVHRCELSGLASGTEYAFRIGADSPAYRFRTMPAKATDTIQFVSGGDCGTNSHAINTNILAAKQEPYFALIGGDLAYDNGRSPETSLQFLRNYSSQMVDRQGRLIPLIACIGNHEVDGSYNQPRSRAASYLSLFDGFYPERTYGVLDIGDYLSLVLLDTGHIAPIGGEQTDWLRATLAERQDRQHLIVANHVPAYPSYRAPEGKDGAPGAGAAQRKHWCPLFEKYKVDVVLEHHDHTFKRTHPLTDGQYDKNGVLYLGDGSWGKLRAPQKPEQRPYLAASSESYHMTVHRLEGPRQFHVALEESGRVADVCMTVGKRPSRRG